MKVQLGFMDLFYGMNVQLVESLWVRNREEAGKADTAMGCCYRPPGYGEEMDRDFFKLKGVSGHTPWFSWGTRPNSCWMGGYGTQPVSEVSEHSQG